MSLRNSRPLKDVWEAMPFKMGNMQPTLTSCLSTGIVVNVRCFKSSFCNLDTRIPRHRVKAILIVTFILLREPCGKEPFASLKVPKEVHACQSVGDIRYVAPLCRQNMLMKEHGVGQP